MPNYDLFIQRFNRPMGGDKSETRRQNLTVFCLNHPRPGLTQFIFDLKNINKKQKN